MILLDENIIDSQRILLQSWGIHLRQMGYEIGRKGMKDEEIIPFLHKNKNNTFFSRDAGFFKKSLCHASYCLVYLAVSQYEVASFIQRFLKHFEFNTQAKRLGKVVLVKHTKVFYWEIHNKTKKIIPW